MNRTRLIVGFLLISGCGSATQGQAKHPEPGHPNEPDYCALASSDENNCMACSSKPGCGWCAQPATGAARCQPGVAGAPKPAICEVELAIGTEACDSPPPLDEY